MVVGTRFCSIGTENRFCSKGELCCVFSMYVTSYVCMCLLVYFQMVAIQE